MKNENPEKVMKWLQSKPSLEDLGTEFPEVLEAVRQEVAEIGANGTLAALPEYLKRMSQVETSLEKKCVGSQGDKKIVTALVLQVVKTRIAHLSIKRHLVSEATGIEKGKVRFNLLNGYFAQRLLFTDGLERKPVVPHVLAANLAEKAADAACSAGGDLLLLFAATC